jgi:hypothetical protein
MTAPQVRKRVWSLRAESTFRSRPHGAGNREPESLPTVPIDDQTVGPTMVPLSLSDSRNNGHFYL